MISRCQPNQCIKLRTRFKDNPLYQLCTIVFHVLQDQRPTMVTTTEQLFVEASEALDFIFTHGVGATEYCHNLWTNKYKEYRTLDAMAADKDDTMFEVAALYYVLMYALIAVNKSFYSGTLVRMLHEKIHKYLKNDKCMGIEKDLKEPIDEVSQQVFDWMAAYFTSPQSISKDIYELLHPAKKAKVQSKTKEIIPYTIYYNCQSGSRVQRIDLLMRLWTKWGWIEEPKTADDFYSLFDGEPRNCNLKWTASACVLTKLMKQMLKQPYIKKTKGCSARSIVMNQFGKKVDNNQNRVDDAEQKHIDISLLILNKTKQLPSKNTNENEDMSDATLYELLSGEIHVTKDLNKQYA